MDNKKPKHFSKLKIVGFIALAVAIIGVILVIIGFGDFETNNFMIGGFLLCFGLFVAVPCLAIGFRPEIAKATTKSIKYIQEENKEDLKDIVNTTADITKDAVKTTSKAIKEGFSNQEQTIYCKYCGSVIDADSVFCKHCGKEQ